MKEGGDDDGDHPLSGKSSSIVFKGITIQLQHAIHSLLQLQKCADNPFSCPETRVLHFGSSVQCWRKEREYETQEIDSEMGTLNASRACTVRNYRGPGL